MQRAHADSQFRRLQPPMLRQDGYVRLISMARHQRRHQQSWYTLRRQPRELYRPAGLVKPCTAPGLQQHAAHKAQRRFSARGGDGLRGQHRDAQVCHVWANNRRAVVLPLGLPECKDPSLMACAEVNLPAAAGKSDDARLRLVVSPATEGWRSRPQVSCTALKSAGKGVRCRRLFCYVINSNKANFYNGKVHFWR